MNEEEKNMNSGAPQSPEPAPAPAPSFDANQAVAKTKETLDKMSNISGWSWGGFMFGPAYLVAVKKYIYLLWYLITLIPILGPLAMLGIAIFLGLKGHSLVAASPMFRNDDERNGFNRAIDHAGFIMFLIALAGFVLGFLFMGLIFGALFHGMGGGNYYY